jgi:hypothetical protein
MLLILPQNALLDHLIEKIFELLLDFREFGSIAVAPSYAAVGH